MLELLYFIFVSALAGGIALGGYPLFGFSATLLAIPIWAVLMLVGMRGGASRHEQR